MAPQPVHETRIQRLNDLESQKGRYVLYWMQQSQRAEYNHALEYAVQQANTLGQGVLVGFGLTDEYPEANLRHYTFMLEGLLETQTSLSEKGIKMIIQRGSPVDVATTLGRNVSLIVCDRGYLRHQKAWRSELARSASCGVVQVESDVVVPIEVVSKKAEYAARTIRPKIHQHFKDYLVPFKSSAVKKSSLDLRIKGLGQKKVAAILKGLSIDRSILPVTPFFKGGTSQGKTRFDKFLKEKLDRYVKNRNQPQTDDISHMSPYIHFGHLSPLYLALRIKVWARGYLRPKRPI
jgi:deoxyribodipyrimidine photo-lyase